VTQRISGRFPARGCEAWFARACVAVLALGWPLWSARAPAALPAPSPGSFLADAASRAATGHDAALPAAAALGRTQRVWVNGIALDIRLLRLDARAAGDRAALLGALAPSWGAPLLSQPSAPSGPGDRIFFGRQRGASHESLTLWLDHAGRSTHALVVVNDLTRSARPMPRAPFPLPSKIRLLSVVQSAADGAAEGTFSARSDLEPRVALAGTVTAALAAGWQPARPAADPRGAIGSARWLQRGRHELTLVAVPVASSSGLTGSGQARSAVTMVVSALSAAGVGR
jgi:hypothetical protein